MISQPEFPPTSLVIVSLGSGAVCAVVLGGGLLVGSVASVLTFLTFVTVRGKSVNESGSTSTTTHDEDDLPPEVVKQKTERWSEEARINPAFPPGQGPNSERTDPIQNDNSVASNSRQTPSEEGAVDLLEMEFNWCEETGVTFDDIGGIEGLKREVQTEILKPLENPEKAEKLGVGVPNIVLHGPPGTGKTYLAKALATELALPVAILSGADVQSKWINESASQVNSLFDEARQVAAREGGAVVFLDELDSILKDRTGEGNSHEEDVKVVNEFLTHLEATKEHNIVFIGATNRVDALDEAGIRSGRIDKQIEIGKPDRAAREAILHAQLKDRPHNLSERHIAELAAQTEGAVAADLEKIIESAANRVLARDGHAIQPRDIAAVSDTN